MEPTAYTVGNPEAYEPYIDEEHKPMKQIGGVVFKAREEAEALVADGFLPTEWFDGKFLPGRVYGLICDYDNDVKHNGHYFALTKPARLVRVPPLEEKA
jgi:hypothetical protein